MQNDVNSFAELALDCLKPKLGGKAPWDTLKDDAGRTPLHLAALHNNAFLVRTIADEFPVRPLASRRRIHVHLLTHPVSLTACRRAWRVLCVRPPQALVQVRCTRGYTPLDWAAVSCSVDALKLLINRGANVKGGGDGPSPLKLTLTLDKQVRAAGALGGSAAPSASLCKRR